MQADDPRQAAARLISAQRWLALGTVDQSAEPSVSYAPFAPAGDAFGVVVSRLAAHTANLVAHRRASVMLVDDDAQQRDAYARTRLSIAVSVRPNAPGSAEADAIWSALESRQSATVGVLRTLPDFQAISLEPLGGRLVMGFASAYDLAAADIVAALRSMR